MPVASALRTGQTAFARDDEPTAPALLERLLRPERQIELEHARILSRFRSFRLIV